MSSSHIHHEFLKRTLIFGIKLWVIIVILIALLTLLSLSVTCFFIYRRRRQQRGPSTTNFSFQSRYGRWEIETSSMLNPDKDRLVCSNARPSGTEIGIQYTLAEIEAATNGFADENLIGSGDHGVVYRGVLLDGTLVAVKKLLVMNGMGNLRDFTRDVEAVWCIGHKNLVKLLGFCINGMYRMLVYEYVDNRNLKQWLHDSVNKTSPLVWEVRMNIIEGIAKGLTYLHEHKILHQHLKSSNVLLDKQWNPKISDFGISNFLGTEWNHVVVRPMGMSGYIAPEYVTAAFLDAKCDVYSFGILIMEIISGKTSVDQSEYLVDWMKSMVQSKEFDQIVDSKLPQMPDLLELKRVILIALRCVDPDVNNRPKMSDVAQMLEPPQQLISI